MNCLVVSALKDVHITCYYAGTLTAKQVVHKGAAQGIFRLKARQFCSKIHRLAINSLQLFKMNNFFQNLCFFPLLT